MERLHLLLTVGALLAIGTGCTSKITGKEGNFQFAYAADDDPLDFNKPIAVGGRLDLRVTQVGTLKPVTLTDAFTDEPGILSVVGTAGAVVTVQGESDGSAELSVEGETLDGDLLGDRVDLQVATPETLAMSHTCQPQRPTAAYLSGQRVRVPYELGLANGRSVIGYGVYPVDVSGTAAVLDLEGSDQVWMLFDTEGTGEVGLSSQLDDTSLTMRVVEAADIDGVAEPVAFVLEDIDVGDTNAFYVLPNAGGDTVCQADVAKTVVADTPDICSIRDRQAPPDSGGLAWEYGWFDITGVAEGTCRYTVTYPDADGGGGVAASFEFPIQP